MNKHLCQNQKTREELININSKIEALTSSSRQGCITDYDEINEIVTKLNETPMSCFNHGSSNTFLCLLEILMARYKLDFERMDEVKYAEALEFIDWVIYSEFFIHESDAWRVDLRYFLIGNLRSMLLLSENFNTTLRLFLAVTVKGYITYIAAKRGETGERREVPFESFCFNIKKHMDYDITEKTTIKEFLLETERFQYRSWLPTMPIKEFEDSIRASYKDLYDFFITDFQYAFRQYFNFYKLEEKYKIKEEDN